MKTVRRQERLSIWTKVSRPWLPTFLGGTKGLAEEEKQERRRSKPKWTVSLSCLRIDLNILKKQTYF